MGAGFEVKLKSAPCWQKKQALEPATFSLIVRVKNGTFNKNCARKQAKRRNKKPGKMEKCRKSALKHAATGQNSA